ncbi:hypothetical protein CTI12_AA308560 [Artemisia annua]|uniref:Uncharacterized protein n=1 Tax=Artemisia annua TaxID=35608 RepID=A0A2U1N479_ARTAN|nr:hypothetical protein CTI12_AA308560 [Artemisia annua]
MTFTTDGRLLCMLKWARTVADQIINLCDWYRHVIYVSTIRVVVTLVANPSIIFMDEPSSGLDARAVAIVMRTGRNTVHTLFLLRRGGKEIKYVGPAGPSFSLLIKYFKEKPTRSLMQWDPTSMYPVILFIGLQNDTSPQQDCFTAYCCYRRYCFTYVFFYWFPFRN